MQSMFESATALPGRRVRRSLAVVWAFMLAGGFITVAQVGELAPRLAWVQLSILLGVAAISAAGFLALERAHRTVLLDRKRLTEVAMHDGLTGLLNRAALEWQVQQ